MKGLTITLACCVGLLGAYDNSIAPKDVVERQKKVLDLYIVPLMPSTVDSVVKAAGEFSFDKYMDHFEHKGKVDKFVEFYAKGLIAVGEPFIPLQLGTIEQAVALYDVLNNAKDFETFFKVSSWARQNINSELFFYVYNVVISQRSDTYNLYVPPMYEIFPHYFVPAESMTKVNFLQMQQGALNKNGAYYGIEFENNNYKIYANYSGWYSYVNDEQKISYFTEDRDLNNCYNYMSTMLPFWSNSYAHSLQYDAKNSYGPEFIYAYYQSFLARYYLERLSNGLGEIPTFNYEGPINTGYSPSLDNQLGIPLTTRPNYVTPSNEDYLDDVMYVKDLETHIRQSIQRGYYKAEDGTVHDLRIDHDLRTSGFYYLLKLLFKTKLSNSEYDYYTIYARNLLGLAKYAYYDKSIQAALDLPYTAVRDPMFYQIYNRVAQFVYMYQEYLTPYTVKQLKAPGIQVKDVTVDKLITYYDYADYPVAGKYLTGYEKFGVDIRQPQLNHAPFAVNFNIYAEKPIDVVVKMYLGPKYDSNGRVLKLNENRQNYFELEKFGYKLNAGENQIIRKSEDFSSFGNNEHSFPEMYEKVLASYNGNGQIKANNPKPFFPDRLMLPKGSKGGYPFQLYVIVYPYVEGEDKMNWMDFQGKLGYDAMNFLYPFDRRIDESHFIQPNMHFLDVPVYHYGGESVHQYGTVNFYHGKWYGKDFSKNLVKN